MKNVCLGLDMDFLKGLSVELGLSVPHCNGAENSLH